MDIQKLHLVRTLKHLHLNILGSALCVAYLLITLFCLWSAYSAETDFKGQFVALQIPLTLPLSLLDLLDLSDWIKNWDWVIGYAIFVPFTLLVLYGIGAAITRIWQHSKLLAVIIILLPWSIIWFRHPLRILYRAIFSN
jgi:hypothetical protein